MSCLNSCKLLLIFSVCLVTCANSCAVTVVNPGFEEPERARFPMISAASRAGVRI